MISRSRQAVLASLIGFAFTGCRSNNGVPLQQAPIVDGSLAANDPANANLPPASEAAQYGLAPQQSVPAPQYSNAPQGRARTQAPTHQQPATRVASQVYATQPQSSGESYGDPSYAAQSAPQSQGNVYDDQGAPVYREDGPQQQPILGDEYDQYAALLDTSVPEAQQPPPPLPVYEQPETPAPDYLWTPGYWNYAPAGYYYVPGAWVAPPFLGALWTPGWWGGYGSGYRWHHGLWARHVGYYGGINYGYGFIGYGYQGGYWNNDHFLYNRACNRVNERVVNNYTYVRNVTVVNNTYVNNTRVSYAGGRGGIQRPPAPQESYAVREQHLPPMAVQMQQRQVASQNRGQFYAASNGHPQLLAVSRPLQADHNVNLPRGFAPAVSQGQAQPSQPLQARPGFVPSGVARPTSTQPGTVPLGIAKAGGIQGSRPGLPQGLRGGRLPANNRLGPVLPAPQNTVRGGFNPPAGSNPVGPNVTMRGPGQPDVPPRALPQRGGLPVNQVQPQLPRQQASGNTQQVISPRVQSPVQPIQQRQPPVQRQEPIQQRQSQIQRQQELLPPPQVQQRPAQPRQVQPLRPQIDQPQRSMTQPIQRQPTPGQALPAAPQAIPQRAPQPSVQQPRALQPQIQQQRAPMQPSSPHGEPAHASEPSREGGGRPRR